MYLKAQFYFIPNTVHFSELIALHMFLMLDSMARLSSIQGIFNQNSQLSMCRKLRVLKIVCNDDSKVQSILLSQRPFILKCLKSKFYYKIDNINDTKYKFGNPKQFLRLDLRHQKTKTAEIVSLKFRPRKRLSVNERKNCIFQKLLRIWKLPQMHWKIWKTTWTKVK